MSMAATTQQCSRSLPHTCSQYRFQRLHGPPHPVAYVRRLRGAPRYCHVSNLAQPLSTAATPSAGKTEAQNSVPLAPDQVPQPQLAVEPTKGWREAAAPSAAVSTNGVKPAPLASLSGAVPDTRWYTVVALSALAALICSVDRAAISVAILPMSEQFHWSESTKGAINSAFYVGYTLTNLLGGYLASSLSAKGVLGTGVVIWSVFTITTPLAASASMPLLLFNRALMGSGEGVTFPCVQNLVKGWVPADARSRALTLVYSGGQLGTIIALVTAPLIIKYLGWPAVFEVYGALGLLWMLAWQPLVAAHPPLFARQQQQLAPVQPPVATGSSSSSSSQQGPLGEQAPGQSAAAAAAAGPLVAAALVNGNGKGTAAGSSSSSLGEGSSEEGSSSVLVASSQPSASFTRFQDIPWKSFFTNKAFIALIMAHGAFGVGHYVSLSWLPSYYSQEFGVDVQQSALLSVLPWFVTVLVSSSSGWLADYLANSGTLTMTQTRKLMQIMGSVGPALCLLYLAATHDDPGELDMGKALALLTATLALGGFQSAGFASNHQDISSKYAAVLFGITNALSSLMGTCSVYATGVILDATDSWALVFNLVAGFYLVGAVAYISWASAEQQFE